MAVAAVAHVFVFSARPYHFLPASENSRIATKRAEAMLKTKKGDEENPAVYEKTSVRESVQDIFVQGGHHVRSLASLSCLLAIFFFFKVTISE